MEHLSFIVIDNSTFVGREGDREREKSHVEDNEKIFLLNKSYFTILSFGESPSSHPKQTEKMKKKVFLSFLRLRRRLFLDL